MALKHIGAGKSQPSPAERNASGNCSRWPYASTRESWQVSNRELALRLEPLLPFPCIGKDPVCGFLWTRWPHSPRYTDDGTAVHYVDEIGTVWDYYTARYGISPAPAFQPGAVGLIGIDLDRKPGKPDGVALFDSLLNEHGDLPPCPVTISPSIGYHLIMKQQPGRPLLGNKEGWFLDRTVKPPQNRGVNIRGKNGYLLCPGALLIDPDTGEYHEYKSAPGCPDLLEAFLSDTIPVIPDWLVALIEDGAEPDCEPLGCPETVDVRVQPSTDARSTAQADAYIEQPLKDRVNTLAGMPAETGRNNYLNSAVFYISGLIHHPTLANTSINQSEVWDAMHWAYSQHPSRKRNAWARFRNTFLSAWNAGARKRLRGPAPDPQGA
jgi:Bifunctional DNA primase/polymerase, N-terminal